MNLWYMNARAESHETKKHGTMPVIDVDMIILATTEHEAIEMVIKELKISSSKREDSYTVNLFGVLTPEFIDGVFNLNALTRMKNYHSSRQFTVSFQ